MRAPRRFSENDRAILRICRRNGWSLERDWQQLSDREQIEWLADDTYRQARIADVQKALNHREHGILDVNAYVALMMEAL